jgi:flagellar hook-associated protein 3 FlgL
MRLGTANAYDNTLANLTNRQASLSDLQEKLSAGKKVVRASDDPTGAAQAERAMTRSARVDVEQRALNLQRNSIAMAESTLGDSTNLLQNIRELVVSAGDAAYDAAGRTSIAQQMTSLRDQLFAFANKQDSNGIPLFGGLGSPAAPFTDAAAGVTFNGLAGQAASTPVSIPGAMDGQATWMNVPTGNGVFNVTLAGANTGGVWTDVGQVVNPAALTGHNYSVNFSVSAATPPVTTYNVFDDTLDPTHAGAPLVAAAPYTDGQTIQFGGLSFTSHGAPANGDVVQITPSTRTNLFNVLDTAIASIKGSNNGNKLSQAIALSLAQIDTGMDRVQSARGQAGDLLNRADTIDNSQQAKSLQLEADRSRAEDMDMVKGISQLQSQQTGYSAALQTYAQVQKLSLFNYIG